MRERWSVAKMILLVTFAALGFYILHQVLRHSGWGWPGFLATIFWIIIVFVLALIQPLYFWGKEKISDSPWVERLQIIGYLAIHYVSDILTLVMIRDVVGFSVWGGSQWGWWYWDGWDLYTGHAATVLIALPFVLLGLGYLVVRWGPFVKEIKIKDPRIPSEFDGFVIAHMSDIHLGPMMSFRLCQNLVRKLKSLKFDALVMTGDIVDCDTNRYAEDVEWVKDFTAPEGTFYCPGNHEYYWGLEKAMAPIRKTETKVLINQSAEIKKGNAKIRFWGVPDPISKYFPGADGFDWKKLSPPKDGAFEILLAHQPHIVDEARHLGFHMQMSGHTHAGQFFPWNFLIIFFQKYSKGLYRVRANKKAKESPDDLWLYVNQGTGFWGPPTRLGTYGEITLITLKSLPAGQKMKAKK